MPEQPRMKAKQSNLASLPRTKFVYYQEIGGCFISQDKLWIDSNKNALLKLRNFRSRWTILPYLIIDSTVTNL